MERELEGEQKYSGEQKNFGKADTKSKKQTKKRAKNRAQQQTDFYKDLYSFFLTAHIKRKKESRTKAEKHTYIIRQRKTEANRKSKRTNKATRTAARERGIEGERIENNFYLLFDHRSSTTKFVLKKDLESKNKKHTFATQE